MFPVLGTHISRPLLPIGPIPLFLKLPPFLGEPTPEDANPQPEGWKFAIQHMATTVGSGWLRFG